MAFNLPSCSVPEGTENRWMRRPPGFSWNHCTLSSRVEKLPHIVELAPSCRLRAGGLCATSNPLAPDEKERRVIGEGHSSVV